MSRYIFRVHALVEAEDLVKLPKELVAEFENVFKPILIDDPYNCHGFTCYQKRGKLANYHGWEIDYNGVAYRLIYRIYEYPAPKRVFVISFDEHDEAYDKAKQRSRRN